MGENEGSVSISRALASNGQEISSPTYKDDISFTHLVRSLGSMDNTNQNRRRNGENEGFCTDNTVASMMPCLFIVQYNVCTTVHTQLFT